MFVWQGKTALITGASSGIGAAFARELAARGMKLVLTARDREALERLAAELTTKHQAPAHIIVADLSAADAVAQITSATRDSGLAIDLLINNAGLMTYGPFEESEAAQNQAALMVNIAALVNLTRAYLPAMLERQSGAMINVASVAAFQPVPYLSLYAATKAFVLSFSTALWEECRGRKVNVLALCPGTTATQLFDRAQAPEAALGKPRTPEQVVATALAALTRGRSIVVDGWKNSLLSHGPRVIPRWFAAKCAGQAVRRRNEPK